MEHLAWPGAVVLIVLGLAAMAFFRPELRGFFARLHEVGWKGLLAHRPTTPQETTDIIPAPSKVDELLKGFDNQLLVELEKSILQFLKENAIAEPAERERFLVRHLASANLVQFLENTYNTIFGSQIMALQSLNQSADLPMDVMRAWYAIGTGRAPVIYENWAFENWLEYLQHSMLVNVNGDRVQITPVGNEFLRYLVQTQKSVDKVG